MRISIRKLFTAGLAALAISMVSSCYSPFSDEESAPYAVVELKNGTVFTFTLPSTGSTELGAKMTASHTSSDVVMYTVSGLSAADVPYDSFTLELIPAQTTPSGTVAASATVKVITYSASTVSTPIDSNYYPKSRVFNLDSSTSMTSANYDVPLAIGGTLKFEWAVDDDHAVLPDATYTDYTFKTYSVKSVKVLAKVKG